jgi:hypothetical protein
MRRIVCLASILAASVSACRPSHAPDSVTPVHRRDLAIDSGTLVRTRLADGKDVTGRLLARFDSTSDRFVLCLSPESCEGLHSSGVLAIPLSDVVALHARGKATAVGFRLGVYGGMLIGAFTAMALADSGADQEHRDDAAATGMIVGILGGFLLGPLIGSRFNMWIPVFPCGPHLCY